MSDEPIEQVIADLEAEEWLQRGVAVRRLFRYGPDAVKALDKLFRLTVDAKAPIASGSRRLIRTLGRHAVPFLRERVTDAEPESREQAIWLLMECGCRRATSTRSAEQVLRERYAALPDWGCDPEEIFAMFLDALSDESLEVRFAAASALEEFCRQVAQTVRVFIEVLRYGSSDSQNWAALRLGRIGPLARPACEALRSARLSECPYTALAAVNALRSVGCVEILDLPEH
jgi:HEAT repeat protein